MINQADVTGIRDLMRSCGFTQVPRVKTSNELVFFRRHHYRPDYEVWVSTAIILDGADQVIGKLEGRPLRVFPIRGQTLRQSYLGRLPPSIGPTDHVITYRTRAYLGRLYAAMRLVYRDLNRQIRQELCGPYEIPF